MPNKGAMRQESPPLCFQQRHCVCSPGTILSDSSKSYYKKFSPFYQKALSMTVPGPVLLCSSSFHQAPRWVSLTQFYSNTHWSYWRRAPKPSKNLNRFLNTKTTMTGTWRLRNHTPLPLHQIRCGIHPRGLPYCPQLARARQPTLAPVDVTTSTKSITILRANSKGYGYKVKWNKNTDWFKKWKDGTTGYPIVDASMRKSTALAICTTGAEWLSRISLPEYSGLMKLGEILCPKIIRLRPHPQQSGVARTTHATGSEARPVSQTVF